MKTGFLKPAFALLLLWMLLALPVSAPPGRFVDDEHGKLELGEHLLEHNGMLPAPIVFAEPAAGHGRALAGPFLD